MIRRPWPIIILAILHVLAPFANAFLVSYMRDMEVGAYFAKFFEPGKSFEAFMVFGLSPLAGFCIYACKRWSLWSYFLLMLGALGYTLNAFLQQPAEEVVAPALMFYFFNFALVGYFLIPAVQNIYLDPKIRWWESAPRFNCQFSAEYLANRKPAFGQVVNISETGMFIKSSEIPRDGLLIDVALKSQGEKWVFSGQVIHHNRQDEVGFGVRFTHSKQTRATIRQITDELREKGHEIRKGPFGEEEDFLSWLKKVLKSGRGIIPKSKDR